MIALIALAAQGPAGTVLSAQSSPAAPGSASTPLDSAVVGSQAPDATLQRSAERIVAATGGEWSVFAWSIDRERPLVAINADRVMAPASNNKVLTGIWALDMLGPEYRFPTDLLVTGPVEGGVLRGDVIIRGSGDPAFGYPPPMGYNAFVEPPMTPLDKMAARLKDLGITRVEGNIIGDPTAFDSVLIGPRWPSDTGGGAAAYAPRVSGLPFQRNMLWVEARAEAGGAVRVITDPQVTAVPVVSTVRSGGSNARVVRFPADDTIRVMGSISGGGPHRYGVGVADPALLTTDALRYALTRAGITVSGESLVGVTPENAELVHRHYSMPLGDMLPFLGQRSDNFFAEHLWKAATRVAIGVGSYTQGGPAAALHFIENAGVEPGQLFQVDGSGLSSLNRVSAMAFVQALVYAHHQPYSELWHASLAEAGKSPGTLARLFVGTPAAGNLHAKTGYINGVRTLSGYVTAADGELIAFSFLYNGANTSGARESQSRLGLLLTGYQGDGTAPQNP
ncbi:MAG: D-alanyl-D-alanine carboxypeptidase/D-alanyl-D-alanine-endopeptidase [Gemmatimonadota bacterium]|jgi:D-alanyl-D-alanine carboxypeptidase/D-alanyl-D-alanine-endopeptidase (penicillin-binding protein 4)|nr:D-alanyl-D-alanine carboxypeptidase/D-alanyl-D-alanine-endopeptidase [Gemmatimonadota bacterium]